MNFDIKIIVLGESFVGKTNILNRYINSKFIDNQKITIGIEFYKNIINYQNKKINILFWDTAGLEKYRGITRAYYKENSGIILVYDVSNRESFNMLEFWKKEIFENKSQNSIILLWNKKDWKREVTYNEAFEYATKNNYLFEEVSAKEDSESIDVAFDKIIKHILRTHISNKDYQYNNTDISYKTKLSSIKENNKNCC